MPNTYFVPMDAKRVARLIKRLRARLATKLSNPDVRALRAAERGDIILEAFHRHTVDGTRREYRTVFGINSAERVHLREVKNKPGYVTREAA